MNVSTSTAGIRRRTAKSSQEVEENAATLHLGQEFELEQYTHDGQKTELIALNLSEARILIRAALKERKRIMKPDGSFVDLEGGELPAADDDEDNGTGKDEDNDEIAKAAIAVGANEVLKKTLDYLTAFARFRDTETCSAVEQLLKGPRNDKLHPFELAQLGSLTCDDADEAKTLIPSLTDKLGDDELTSVLQQLGRLETPY